MEDIILKNVLINSVEHGGKANVNSVLGRILSENPKLKDSIRSVIEEIKENISRIEKNSLEEQEKMLKKFKVKKEHEKEQTLPDLQHATRGKVVMRMAPYPSGPLHIGNSRMVLLNDEYVKRYGGKLFLVYDDTIGSEEKFIIDEAYDMIKDSLVWLGVKVNSIFYKSDRMEIFYKNAEMFIKKELAYVCLCVVDQLRKLREEGNECSHRSNSVKENLSLWNRMLDGKLKEGEVVVRIKTDMKHPNPAFRDRVLLKITDRKHPRVGTKYKVWPSLEFSWAVDDYMLGITHVLRGKDLVIEDRMEEFIWEKLGWEKSHFVHYGMLNVEEAKLSKTESRKNIESGEYSGWDDPRTWTLQSLKRRGIQPKAIRKFILNMGMSLADVNVPAEILYAENRKIVDRIANRYFLMINPVAVKVRDAPKIKQAEAPLHPDFPKRGKRKIPVDLNELYVDKDDLERFDGQEIRLIDLFNVRVKGNSLEYVDKYLKPELKKIQWISKNKINIKLVMSDGSNKTAIAEPTIKNVNKDDIIQAMRVGFFRVDKNDKKEIVLYFAHK